MKREKARIQELRNMPYEEYLHTPEWQETQKAALLRAKNQCQGCKAEKVTLSVYHTTYDNLGCEQEADLVALCEACSDHLVHSVQLTGRDVVPTDPGEEKTLPDFSFGAKAAVFAPAAVVGLGLPALLHAPLPAEIFGLVAAIALAANSPKIYAEMRSSLPAPLIDLIDGMVERKQARAKRREWNTWDRLIGRHLYDQEKRGEEEHSLEPSLEQESEPGNHVSGEPVFPQYPDDETLKLGQTVDKDALVHLVSAFARDRKSYSNVHVPGRRFEPHINGLFGSGVIISAVQGSGKSMLCGLLIEQAGGCDCPEIILDHKGEYNGIAELPYLSGLIAGGPSARRRAERKGIRFFELTPKNVDEFVSKVINGHLQAIVSLPSYGEKWIERASIVAAIGQALMRYSARQIEEEKENQPCLVFLDEAQLYIPENIRLLPPEAFQNQDTLNNLSNAFFSLVSNGRSNGYTMCFATQSLTYIAKWAIKSCQIKVLLRHSEHNDLELCEKIIGKSNKGLLSREEIESLPPGVGFVSGLSSKPKLIRFDKRESRDFSATPGIERLRASRIASTEETANRTTTDQATRQRHNSNQLEALDVETITRWFTGGKIDQESFLALLKTITQPETDLNTRGNGMEIALQNSTNMREDQVFPVSTPMPTGVSIAGNSGNSDDNTLETAPEAGLERVITGVFPATKAEAQTSGSRSEIEKLGVSLETVEHIKRMKELSYTDRDISDIVGMRGRKYDTYKKVLIVLGYRERA